MASYEKRGKSIRAVVSVMDHGTRRKVSKTFSGKRPKKEAEDWALHMEVDKADNRQILTSNMLFSDYFKRWYETYKTNNIRNSTLYNYGTCYNLIVKYYRGLKLSNLSHTVLQKGLDEYAKGDNKKRSKSTVAFLMKHMQASLNDALIDGYVDKDFWSRLKANGARYKHHNYLSATEFERLQSYLYDHWQDSPYHLAVLVGLETGMRIGEILMISKDEVFPEFNTIFVKKSYSPSDPSDERTKNAASRRKIKIPERLSSILKVSIKNKKGRLFPMAAPTLGEHEKKIMDNLGIKEITFHGLRHSHVSYLLYKGLSLEYVAKRVGHVDTTTTQKVYAHLLKEQEEKEDEKTMELLGVSPNVPKKSDKAQYNKG